jgi:hypothetical protein
VFVQRVPASLSHLLMPFAHVSEHPPSLHTNPGSHFVAQLPQFDGSFVVSTHV